MSKIIKKQIKRSFSALMIMILISQIFTVLVYNFIFNEQKNNSIELAKEAQAQADVTSSLVTVKNAPPNITSNAAENPISSSTSPVNIGGSIPFTITADDPENNNYYLIVCDSDSVNPGAGGGAPSCGGTQFCVSSVTNDTNQATCTYNSVTDSGLETDDWYAFVCDNHATESDCSTSNQGSGDSGSPIYLNHAPSFTSVTTTDNFKDPGGTFTIEATATDGDVAGEADVLIIAVCTTNSWNVSTGCAATTLCTGTSTTPNVSCQYTDTAPTPDQAYTYYAFVKDWHTMAATGNSRSSTYTINNVAPEVSNISFNSGGSITLNIKGASVKTVYATSTSVVDNNGCTDLSDATSTVFMSNAASGAACAANDNDCYKVTSASCSISDCSGASDTTATVTCSAGLAFHAIPTTASGDNPYASYDWLAYISAYDEASAGFDTSAGVEVAATAALEVSEATIAYGSIHAGENSGAANATTTIINYGNTPLDNQVEGTWMTKGSDAIPENNQEFDLNNFTWGAGTYTLSSTTPANVDIVVARPTNSTNLSDMIYWGINIPTGIPSGDYGGTNTFSAVLDTAGGNWN